MNRLLLVVYIIIMAYLEVWYIVYPQFI